MNYEMRGEGDDMRIAIVEDEQALALELHALLQKLGSHADLYSSGEQFLFAWEEQPYELVFLDIQMQGLNGLETARRLRKKDTHAYLVFLTNDPSFVFEGYEVDASFWISWKHQKRICYGPSMESCASCMRRIFIIWRVMHIMYAVITVRESFA